MVDAHSPLDFNNPHSDPPETAWYHPLAIAWLVVEIIHVSRRWFWQKRQSWRASRTNVTFNAVMALQRLSFIADDEDLPRSHREEAREAQEFIVRICDELNIEDDRIDRYADDGGEES